MSKTDRATLWVYKATSKMIRLPVELQEKDEAGEFIDRLRGEFAVERQLQAKGIECAIATKLEMVRLGKQRRAKPQRAMVLPNYIFITLRGSEIFKLSEVSGLSRMGMAVPLGEERKVRSFLERMSEAERNFDRAQSCEFKTGDQILAYLGPFGEQMVEFKRMVDGSEHPVLEVHFEVMGKEQILSVDPLDARKAG